MGVRKGNLAHWRDSFLDKFHKLISQKGKYSERQIFVYGIILTLNYFIYYVIWSFLSPQGYENLALRASASFFCFLLVLKDFWPKRLIKFLPIYWYFVVLYTLPFFFTFMTLMNHASVLWLMNCVSVLFFLVLLFDLISVVALLILGTSLGYFAYTLVGVLPFTVHPSAPDFTGILATFAAILVITEVFSYNQDQIQQAKLDAMQLVMSSIAHELRTPLAAIDGAAAGVRAYLPELLSTYETAKAHALTIPRIFPHQLDALKQSLETVTAEIAETHNIIDMLLMNVQQNQIDPTTFTPCSFKTCLDHALARYPFVEEDRQKVVCRDIVDFQFKGSEILTIHLFFNLIKNSLYYLAAAGKGHIEIWVEDHPKRPRVHFKDTGKGIDKSILPHIFDKFYSKTYHGYGIGLAFCKMVMRSYGGDIRCHSVEGEYVDFVMEFPRLSAKSQKEQV